MAAEHTLSGKVQMAMDLAERALQADTLSDYEELQVQIGKLEVAAREVFQLNLKEQYTAIASKLEHGERLNDEEYEQLELLIVGDAKYYTKLENNVPDWISEVQRLIGELRAEVADGVHDANQVLTVQGLTRDMIGVVNSLTRYMAEKNRLERFKQSTRGSIDLERSRLLANMIREKLESRSM
jgi:hypothetical protein